MRNSEIAKCHRGELLAMVFSLSDFFGGSGLTLEAGNGTVTGSGNGFAFDITPGAITFGGTGFRSLSGSSLVIDGGDVSGPGFNVSSGSTGTQIDFLGIPVLFSGAGGTFINLPGGSFVSGRTAASEVTDFSSVFTGGVVSTTPDGTGSVDFSGFNLNFGPEGTINFPVGSISYGSGSTVIDFPFFSGIF
jgi:hypothetical protein